MVSSLVPLSSALLVVLNKESLVTVGRCVVRAIRTNYFKDLLRIMF